MLRPRTEATKEVLLSRKGSLYRWTLLNLLISLPPSYCQCARQTVQLIIHIPHSITPSDVHPRDTAPCVLFQARCTHQRFLSWEINFLFSSKTSHSEDFFLFCHCCFVMFSPGWEEMPKQEMYDCQPFSELCTRADLILSSSPEPRKWKRPFYSPGTLQEFSMNISSSLLS